MKLIIAIIQPTKLNALRAALLQIGVERMTVCDAQGYGQQRGHTSVYRGVEYKTNLLRKITLEIAVNDDFLDRTIDTSQLPGFLPINDRVTSQELHPVPLRNSSTLRAQTLSLGLTVTY